VLTLARWLLRITGPGSEGRGGWSCASAEAPWGLQSLIQVSRAEPEDSSAGQAAKEKHPGRKKLSAGGSLAGVLQTLI